MMPFNLYTLGALGCVAWGYWLAVVLGWVFA